MSADVLTLEEPLLKDRPPAATREAQDRGTLKLPENLKIVSTDGHWEIAEDIFYQGFPASLKHEAPRVWFDRYWHCGYPDRLPKDPESLRIEDLVAGILELSVPSGAWDLDLRIKQQDIEGIQQEIVYPQSLLAFTRHPDLAVQERVYRIYNEYMAHVFSSAPNRYFGVGVCSNWWEPSKAKEAIRQIVDLGLKTFMLPTSNAGKTLDGRLISYGGQEMDLFWDEVAAADIPVAFHVGENAAFHSRGAHGSYLLQTMSPFRKPLGELIFGGVFDRHPNLKVVFAEGGIAWVPAALQDAETIYDAHGALLDVLPKHRPCHYWHQNCFATFQNDLLGLRLLDYIGADRVMWAADYPHNEGSLGYTWDSLDSVVRMTGEKQARKILGETASALYRI
jgi:predicted TIM-barrel fold metal-dependent hydrolase